MLAYCQLYPKEQISVSYESNETIFNQENPIEYVVCLDVLNYRYH